MSRVTDEDLRAAFRVRASGRPHPGLRQRIRSSTFRSQAPRVDPVSDAMGDRRPILVRLTAIAAVAAVLLVAPLLGAESELPQGLGPATGSPAGPAVVGGVPVTTEDDDDGPSDDVGDGEDGVDEVADGADEDDGDDEGDAEDGVDGQDDGADEEQGDDDE